MQPRSFRRLLVHRLNALVANQRLCAGSGDQRHHHRCDRRRAAGRRRSRRQRSERQQLRGGHRFDGQVRDDACASAATALRRSSAGFATVERRGVQVQVGQQAVLNLQMAPATLQESVTVTGEAPLVDTTAVEPWKQHRRAAGTGPAGQRTQLHGPDAAGRRQPPELRGRDAGGKLSAERRRPAGDAADRDQLRPAALQQGHDRRVRGDHEPVRRAAGAIDRHPGQRDHEVGHERPGGTLRRLLPRRPSSTRRTSSRRRCCRTRTSSSA